MTDIPYGFDATRPYLNDDGLRNATTKEEAWAKLDDVRTHLVEQKKLPPELAQWLGEAIRRSGRDGDRFLQELGVNRRAGEKGPYSRSFKAYWQGRLWHIGTYSKAGRSIDAMVAEVGAEMEAEGLDEMPTRETLQDWFNEAMTGNTRNR